MDDIGEMQMIDVQVHAYERNHPRRPWQGTLSGPDEMTGEQMVMAFDHEGVGGAILVSPTPSIGTTRITRSRYTSTTLNGFVW